MTFPMRKIEPMHSVYSAMRGSIIFIPFVLLIFYSNQVSIASGLIAPLIYWLSIYILQRLNPNQALTSSQSTWLLAHFLLACSLTIIQTIVVIVDFIQSGPTASSSSGLLELTFQSLGFHFIRNSVFGLMIGFIVFRTNRMVEKMFGILTQQEFDAFEQYKQETIRKRIEQIDNAFEEQDPYDYQTKRVEVLQRMIKEAKEDSDHNIGIYAIAIENWDTQDKLVVCTRQFEYVLFRENRSFFHSPIGKFKQAMFSGIANDESFKAAISNVFSCAEPLLQSEQCLDHEMTNYHYYDLLTPIYVISRASTHIWHINRHENYSNHVLRDVDQSFNQVIKKIRETNSRLYDSIQ